MNDLQRAKSRRRQRAGSLSHLAFALGSSHFALSSYLFALKSEILTVILMTKSTKPPPLEPEITALDRPAEITTPHSYNYGVDPNAENEIPLLDYWRAIRKRHSDPRHS